jgi:hypothetical protein
MSEPDFRMKIVGRRDCDRFSWEDVDQLLKTVAVVRGTAELVPRGVYRFRSFEEADRWMIEMILRTHACRSSQTSVEFVAR